MKTPPLKLEEIYNQTLSELLAAEKKYAKIFEQMASAAFIDELRKGISAEATEIDSHIDRLTQVISIQKLKVSRVTSAIDDELMKMSKEVCGFIKQQSVLKDIQILHCAKTILAYKIAAYESLYLMAKAIGKDHAFMLLEQSFKDNQNTYGYLTQISQNILYPRS